MWLYIPGMHSPSCPSAPAPEGSTSDSSCSWGSDYAPSASSSGKPWPRPSSWPGWKKRPWIKLLSGLTFDRSTAARGAERWIASLLATRASRSATPESALESVIRDISGPMSDGLLSRYVRHWSSSRTSQTTFASALEPYEPSYERWVTGLKRDYSARRRLAEAINADGSSRWPTARAEDAESAGRRVSRGVSDTLTAATAGWQTPKVARGGYSRDKGKKGAERPTLIGQAEGRQWPTPTAGYAQRGEAAMYRGETNPSLGSAAQGWSTPTARDGKGAFGEHTKGGQDLPHQVQGWPTPAARDGKGANAGHGDRKGRKHMDQLPNYVAHLFPTPTAAQYGSSQNGINGKGGANERPSAGTPSLERLSRSLPRSPETPTDGHECSSRCRRLNPLFVEWLMNWPIGWTGFDSLGTEFTRWLQQSRSHLFGSACETAEAA